MSGGVVGVEGLLVHYFYLLPIDLPPQLLILNAVTIQHSLLCQDLLHHLLQFLRQLHLLQFLVI